MTSTKRARRLGGTIRLAVALVAAVALPAAEAAIDDGQVAPPPASFGAVVDVELVEVEVFVSDRRGTPISGLTAGDFELTIDGRPRPIAGVYEARPQPELATPVLSTEPAAAPAPGAMQRLPAPSLDRQGSLVVLLDDQHLKPVGRKRTLERLAPMLEQRIAAGDKVMVAVLGRALEVRRGFEDSGPLGAALASAAGRPSEAIDIEFERRDVLAEIIDIQSSARGCEAFAEMRMVAARWAQRVEPYTRRTLDTLRMLLDDLGGRSGRKALLYVSEGVALTPGIEAAAMISSRCSTAQQPLVDLMSPLSQVTRGANASQVTLYALDAGGLRAASSVLDLAQGQARVDMVRQEDSEQPLFTFAAETGGKALVQSNHPERLLADLAQDLVAHYSLAFAPVPADHGRSHSIRVEVRRPGARVRHRSSWNATTPAQRLEARLLAALHFGGEETNPLLARLEPGSSRRDADGNVTLPLTLLVPARTLVLLPRGDRRQGSLRVLFAAQDREGRTTPVRSVALPVDLPAGPAPPARDDAEVPLELRFKLRPGHNTIVVAVHDQLGSATSLMQRAVSVGMPGR